MAWQRLLTFRKWRLSTARRGVIRIPPELDVPLTPRVRRIIDTADFRRLARISQLGLVCAGLPGGDPHAVRAFAGRVSDGAAVPAAACRTTRDSRSHRRRGCQAVLGGRAAARPRALAVLPSDRRHPPAERPVARACSPTAFCSKARSADVLREDWQRRSGATWSALLSEQAARREDAHPGQHALRSDRHRQDGLPGPRQPARRRPLRPQLRPAAAHRQPLPERRRATGWRSPTKARPRPR